MGLHAVCFGMSRFVLCEVDVNEVDRTMLEEGGGGHWVSNAGKPH